MEFNVIKMIRISFIVAATCMISAGCATKKKGDFPVEMQMYYSAVAEPDSLAGVFVWQQPQKIPHSTAPTIYKWHADTSLVVTYKSKSGAQNVSYLKVRLTAKEQKLFPPTLLNGEFQFLGVYEYGPYKGSGLYMVFYWNKKQLLIQIRESLYFLTSIFTMMPSNENVFEKKGFQFPYKKEIHFR